MSYQDAPLLSREVLQAELIAIRAMQLDKQPGGYFTYAELAAAYLRLYDAVGVLTAAEWQAVGQSCTFGYCEDACDRIAALRAEMEAGDG